VEALDSIRLFLHVLAASVWVGGQLTLAALVPALRAVGPEVTQAAARRFRLVAWPAFAVLLITGIWNVLAGDTAGGRGLLTAKLVAVAVSGAAAYGHQRATTRRGLAIGGALSLLGALAAMLLGVMLGEQAS